MTEKNAIGRQRLEYMNHVTVGVGCEKYAEVKKITGAGGLLENSLRTDDQRKGNNTR